MGSRVHHDEQHVVARKGATMSDQDTDGESEESSGRLSPNLTAVASEGSNAPRPNQERRGSLLAIREKLRNMGKSSTLQEMNAEARPNLPRSTTGGAFFGAAVATALAVKNGFRREKDPKAKQEHGDVGQSDGWKGARKKRRITSSSSVEILEHAGTAAKSRLFRLVESLAPGASFQLEKEVSLNEQKIQLNDLMSFLAIASVALAILDVELYPQQAQAVGSIVIRSCVTGICGLMCLLLARLYRTRLAQMKLVNRFLVHENLFTAGLIPPLLFECLVVCLHLPPKVEFSFPVDEAFEEREYRHSEGALALLTFLRLYVLLKSARDHSVIFRGHGRALSRANGISPDFSLAMRAYIALYPLRTLVVSFLAVLCVSSYALLIFERAYDPHYGLSKALWNLFIGMTTVGFGDIYPNTYPGRVVIATAILCGLVLTATATTVMIDKARLHPGEERIVRTMKGAMIMTEYRVAAARCIQAIFRWHDRKVDRDRKLTAEGHTGPKKRVGFDALELRALAQWQNARKRKQRWDEFCDSIQAQENMKDGAIRSVEEKLNALVASHDKALKVAQGQAEQATDRARKEAEDNAMAAGIRAAALAAQVKATRDEIAEVAARQAALSEQVRAVAQLRAEGAEAARLLSSVARALSLPHEPAVRPHPHPPPAAGAAGTRPRVLPALNTLPSPAPDDPDREQHGSARKPFRARSRRRSGSGTEAPSGIASPEPLPLRPRSLATPP
eukprot:tig00000158_g10184.t1